MKKIARKKANEERKRLESEVQISCLSCTVNNMFSSLFRTVFYYFVSMDKFCCNHEVMPSYSFDLSLVFL